MNSTRKDMRHVARGCRGHGRLLLDLVYLVAICGCLSGCSYTKSLIAQAHYSAQQKLLPTQRVSKQMLDRDNFFVFGRIGQCTDLNPRAVAVLAISDQHRKDEIVDSSQFCRMDSYYGLNLPAGEYRLLVVSDRNGDGFYDQTEVAGSTEIVLNRTTAPEKVLGEVHIDLTNPCPPYPSQFRLPVQQHTELSESFVYPRGTIRSLDDGIFSSSMASLGLYEPAAFLERAPMMFYALEEDAAYKVPVVFVHGINGSARDFADIVAKLDRSRYKPWFFHYPSGYGLSQLSEIFHSIFLSGKVIPLGDMPLIIVAHSMGGLVVRDALSRATGDRGEAHVKLFITIASPMGGHPDASAGASAPMVIPSWRDLAPDSTFMQRLYRQELPEDLGYHLLYAFGNPSHVKLGENSDGVVPLLSQLDRRAQQEAVAQYGFNASHEGILQDSDAIGQVIALIGEIPSLFPEDHLQVLQQGGFQVELGTGYTPLEKYLLKTIGHYMEALASGRLAPIHPTQDQFLRAARGEKPPDNEFESAWCKFRKDFPDQLATR